MLVRYLVNAWIRQAAQTKLQEAVSEIAREASPAAASQPSEQTHDDDAGEARPCEAAFMFALGVESGGLVDRWDGMTRRRFKHRTEYHGFWLGRRVMAVDAGVGLDAARRATERVIARYQPRWVVSAGFAAALQAGIRRGHILMAESVIGPTGEEFQVGLKMDPQTAAATRGLHVGRLLTVDHLVRSGEERKSLGEQYGAVACDMETAAVAEVCHRLKTRFLTVRVMSDTLDDDLPPEIEALVSQKNTAARLGAAAGALFNRPSSVKEMWRLKEEALKSSDRLAKFLEGVLGQLP